jgi:hypothetical protein
LKSRIFAILFFPALLLFQLPVLARSGVYTSGAKAASMGGAFVSRNDFSSIFHNQAGLTGITGVSGLLFYESKFLLPELSNRGIAIGIPAGKSAFALHYSAFGPSKWMESTISLAYALDISPSVSGGLQFNYYSSNLPEENGRIMTAGAELGFIFHLSPAFHLGVHASNLVAVPFYTLVYEEYIPSRIRLGGHYFVTSDFILAAEAELFDYNEPAFRLGLEWKAIDNLFFRGGFSSGQSNIHAGVGFLYQIFKIDIAFSYHQVLGLSPMATFSVMLP